MACVHMHLTFDELVEHWDSLKVNIPRHFLGNLNRIDYPLSSSGRALKRTSLTHEATPLLTLRSFQISRLNDHTEAIGSLIIFQSPAHIFTFNERQFSRTPTIIFKSLLHQLHWQAFAKLDVTRNRDRKMGFVIGSDIKQFSSSIVALTFHI